MVISHTHSLSFSSNVVIVFFDVVIVQKRNKTMQIYIYIYMYVRIDCLKEAMKLSTEISLVNNNAYAYPLQSSIVNVSCRLLYWWWFVVVVVSMIIIIISINKIYRHIDLAKSKSMLLTYINLVYIIIKSQMYHQIR